MDNHQVENINFPVIIKRSPASVAIQIAVVVFFSLLFFIVITILGDTLSGVINSPWLGVSIATTALIGLSIINVLAITIALFKWTSEYYEVHEDEIVHARGIISKKRRSYPLDKVETMNVSQNFIERMLDFGDISLLNPVLPRNRRLRLLDIPHPQKYLDLIKKIQQHLVEEGTSRRNHTIYMQDDSGGNGQVNRF